VLFSYRASEEKRTIRRREKRTLHRDSAWWNVEISTVRRRNPFTTVWPFLWWNATRKTKRGKLMTFSRSSDSTASTTSQRILVFPLEDPFSALALPLRWITLKPAIEAEKIL
jgi:hypothetical protein